MPVPIKTWTDGVPFEEGARAQVERLATLPIVGPHIAIMPDVHAGIGCVVGSVVPTRKAIVPACVGVDLGCGVNAVRTTLRAEDLPDSLHGLYCDICKAVPHGSSKGEQDVGAHESPSPWWAYHAAEYALIVAANPKVAAKQAPMQLGTLGGGNHFVEVCLDEHGAVWVMLHSGSRGVGNRIGTYFTEKARERALKLDRQLPDRDLAWLDEGTREFDDYWFAVGWAQRYAAENRRIMMDATLAVMRKTLPPFERTQTAISCHHNYVERTWYYGEEIYLTRKGAVDASPGKLGIIPGSMGAKSFIVVGKGNLDSFNSCSHGAGRVMSRGQAKREITVEQHVADTAGVECSKDARVLDESPRAYKDIDAVMAAQRELVDVVATLKGVLCVKG